MSASLSLNLFTETLYCKAATVYSLWKMVVNDARESSKNGCYLTTLLLNMGWSRYVRVLYHVV